MGTSALGQLEEDRPRELIGGEVVTIAPSATNHTLIKGHIYRVFANYLLGKQCIAILGGTVFLTDTDRFVPDVMVVCDHRKIRPDGVHGAPDLVVEVLSSMTARNDRIHKKEVYGQCGVREYWLVSPGDRTVEVFRSNGNDLVLHDVYAMPYEWERRDLSEEERADVISRFTSSLFEDLDISLEDIFDGLL